MTVDDRGTLEVRGRAVGRMAEIAASRVDGVERVNNGIASRSLPYVDATVAGGRIRATVQAATRWPTPIAEIAVRVRNAVEEDLRRHSGLDVDIVDVRMQYSTPDQRRASTRRVE